MFVADQKRKTFLLIYEYNYANMIDDTQTSTHVGMTGFDSCVFLAKT